MVHEKKKRFQCKICSSRFFYKSDMRKHVQIVHEQKKHLMENEEKYFQKIDYFQKNDPLGARSSDRDRNNWFYTVSGSHFEFMDVRLNVPS